MQLRTAAGIVLLLAGNLLAQTAGTAPAAATPTAPPPAPAPAPDPPPSGLLDKPLSKNGFSFSAMWDQYYSHGSNDPGSGLNRYRNFDVNANGGGLNMLKFAIDKEAAPVGFRIDVGFGSAFDYFHIATPRPQKEFSRYLIQAYGTIKPASWKGWGLDFGKFYTSAGAELTETQKGWNYSRSLLYTNGPYFHTGLRLSGPVSEHNTVGVQLVQGWNNIEDNNSGKTVGLTHVWTNGKVTWGNNYYVGPEQSGSSSPIRNFYDTVVTATINDKVSVLWNFDVGNETKGAGHFHAMSGAAQFKIGKYFAFSPRADYYHDSAGITTGVPQTLKEVTLTGDIKVREGFLIRGEFRNDWSNKGVFEKGPNNDPVKSQPTVMIGFVAWIGHKN